MLASLRTEEANAHNSVLKMRTDQPLKDKFTISMTVKQNKNNRAALNTIKIKK